jgi:peptide chain release factor
MCLSLNRRIAIDLLRERIEAGNVLASQAAIDAQWRIHDQLIRGNPTRTERP